MAELPLERLDEYNDLIIKYMNARFNNNVVSAVCHFDEGGGADGKGGLSAKEYKKKMEQAKKELNKKLEDMVKEYNELADRYNKLIDDKAELERKNRERAYEVMYQQEHSR